ncbi:MAG TPA: hypothetical protein VFM18_09675, partial [Methanosarcina sp.]|nr:hypothetical protein [Methanosarcina sp.]
TCCKDLIFTVDELYQNIFHISLRFLIQRLYHHPPCHPDEDQDQWWMMSHAWQILLCCFPNFFSFFSFCLFLFCKFEEEMSSAGEQLISNRTCDFEQMAPSSEGVFFHCFKVGNG